MPRNLVPRTESVPRVNPEGLLIALDLMELGLELARQRIRREVPALSDEEVGLRLQEWIDEAPGQMVVRYEK
jgi:hypothetical protein